MSLSIKAEIRKCARIRTLSTDISRRYVGMIWLVSVSMGCGSGFKNQMDPSDIGLETILMVRHPR